VDAERIRGNAEGAATRPRSDPEIASFHSQTLPPWSNVPCGLGEPV
jgi:hypothetical protein